MKHLLPLATALLLAACHTPKPPVATTLPPADTVTLAGFTPRDSTGRRLDSVVVVPHRTVLDKVLRRTPPPSPLSFGEGVPARIGKKSTVNVYYGPATVTTAGKKAVVAAPGATLVQAAKKAVAVAADSGAAVQVAQARQQAAAGEGINQQQVKPAGWPWWLWLLLAGAVGYGALRIYRKYFTV